MRRPKIVGNPPSRSEEAKSPSDRPFSLLVSREGLALVWEMQSDLKIPAFSEHEKDNAQLPVLRSIITELIEGHDQVTDAGEHSYCMDKLNALMSEEARIIFPRHRTGISDVMLDCSLSHSVSPFLL